MNRHSIAPPPTAFEYWRERKREVRRAQRRRGRAMRAKLRFRRLGQGDLFEGAPK